MIKATEEFLAKTNSLFEKRKTEIRSTYSSVKPTGNTYYVSTEGDDNNDGKSALTPWQTLDKVTSADLKYGDCILFKRGDLFRGGFTTQNGVTYSAYGEGEKPKFYSWCKPLGDKALWEEFDSECHIWKLTEKISDVGTLVFNEGEFHSRKLIPSYRNGQFVCRENEDKIFDIKTEMTKDLDVFCKYDEFLSTEPSKGEDFPIPCFDSNGKGELYLRCDKGNPGEIFNSIEALARINLITTHGKNDVTIDNLCIQYVGMHGVSAGGVKNLTVTNCEFGWIGGCIQHYSGTDPNYPQGRRGSVTRFGNAIEVYGECDGYIVENNYIYEVYDAGVTHQVTTNQKMMLSNIKYQNNLIEKCVYGIEYFLEQIEGERESCMENVLMDGNFIRLSGYGWGQQRHNTDTPALIKGWSYINTARNNVISNNIFDRSAYRMLHLVALKDEFCPVMQNNTYIQHLGATLGQYGANELAEPENLPFNNNAKDYIENIFGDKTAKIYYIKQLKAPLRRCFYNINYSNVGSNCLPWIHTHELP